MSTDDTPQPPTDPRYAALLVRVRRIRVELDRLDDALDLLDRDGRVELGHRAATLRAALDELESDIEREAARTDT